MTPKDWLYIGGLLAGGLWGVIAAQRKDIERLEGFAAGAVLGYVGGNL